MTESGLSPADPLPPTPRRFSVIVPAFNEVENMPDLFQDLAGTFSRFQLNGEIVLLGRLHGVPTPANEALQALGNEMARTGLGPGSFSPDQVRLRIAAVASALSSGGSPGTL